MYAVARASIDSTGLFLLGERHGVVETSSVALTLMRRLKLRGLALEWSHDELGPFVDALLAGERHDVDLTRLQALPPTAEFLSGDGRFGADRVSLLVTLRDEGRLDKLILFDAVDFGEHRERQLAERLLAERDPDVPTLVMVGGAHVPHLLRILPGLGAAFVHVRSGQLRHHGLHDVADLEPPAGALLVEVQSGRPSTCA